MTTGLKITIVNREPETGSYDGAREGAAYETRGVLLGDGRLLTYDTGVDGRDSLWSSIGDYEPNGLAQYESHEISDERVDVGDEELRDADRDNTDNGLPSLLVGGEALPLAEEASDRG